MNLAAKFFLSRGMAKGPEIVAKLVRNGMTTAGGYMLSHNLVSADDWNTVTAAALILGGAAWSIARTFLSNKVGV